MGSEFLLGDNRKTQTTPYLTSARSAVHLVRRSSLLPTASQPVDFLLPLFEDLNINRPCQVKNFVLKIRQF